MATAIGSFGAPLDLRIKQGSTFDPQVTLNNPDGSPVNLTGSTLRAQIRKNALDTEVVATFTINIVDAPNGVFQLVLTDEQTAAIVTGEQPGSSASKFVWDLEMEDSLGRVIPIFYGSVQVFREVTRL